jgi:hypothetical protein
MTSPTPPSAPPTENELGQPYCSQPWCAHRNLANAWLLDTNDGRTWWPCCAYCQDYWISMGATPANGGLIVQPMYITEPAPAPVAAPAPAAAPAAVQEAPRGLWATYKAWRAGHRTEAALAETVVGFAAWGAFHEYVQEGKERSRANFAAREEHTRQTIAKHNQQLKETEEYWDKNWGPGAYR